MKLFNEVNKVATSGMPRSIMTKELKKIFKKHYVSTVEDTWIDLSHL